jgi:hypothetical protein
LRAALPKLRTRAAELQRAEAYARWVAEYDRVKPLRDEQHDKHVQHDDGHEQDDENPQSICAQ